jgi:hypothetical protein
MACQSCNLLHGGVLPHDNLIQRIPMSRYNFICGLGKHQVADLTARVDEVGWLEGLSVPETDASISGAATGSKQTTLIWAPGNSFDCCLVLTEFG